METIVTGLDLFSTFHEAFWLFWIVDIIFERRESSGRWIFRGRLLPVLPVLFYAVIVIAMNNITELTSPYTLPVVMINSMIWICMLWEADALSALAVVGCYSLILMLESLLLSAVFGNIGGAAVLQEAAYEKGLPRLLILVGSIVICFVMNLIIYRILRKKTWDRNGIRYIVVISLLGYIALSFLFMQMLSSFDVQMNGYLFGAIIVIGACILLPYGSMRYRTLSRQMQEIESYNLFLEESYERANSLYMDHARLYHDMNHHLQAIAYMLKEGESGEALEYIESLGSFRTEYQRNNYTGIELVDMILSEKQRAAEKKNISLKITACTLPPDMEIEKKDLCAVMFNLLDNALEAASEQISLQIRVFGRMLAVEIQNDYKITPVIKNGTFQTTKRDSVFHGFGLKNVQMIAEKYDGNFQCRVRTEMFCVQLFMCF